MFRHPDFAVFVRQVFANMMIFSFLVWFPVTVLFSFFVWPHINLWYARLCRKNVIKQIRAKKLRLAMQESGKGASK